MTKRVPFLAALLLLTPCLSAQTTASGGATTASSFAEAAGSSSSSYSYDATTSVSSSGGRVDDASGSMTELWARSYCEGHPDEDWTRTSGTSMESGHCPSADAKSIAVLNSFLAHHKKIASSPTNTQTLVAFVNYNKLNPREEKSYERAYKSLKSTGQLEVGR